MSETSRQRAGVYFDPSQPSTESAVKPYD